MKYKIKEIKRILELASFDDISGFAKNIKWVNLEDVLHHLNRLEEPEQQDGGEINDIAEAGSIAVRLSEHLDAIEQSFFIAGFLICFKYLSQPTTEKSKVVEKMSAEGFAVNFFEWVHQNYYKPFSKWVEKGCNAYSPGKTSCELMKQYHLSQK